MRIHKLLPKGVRHATVSIPGDNTLPQPTLARGALFDSGPKPLVSVLGRVLSLKRGGIARVAAILGVAPLPSELTSAGLACQFKRAQFPSLLVAGLILAGCASQGNGTDFCAVDNPIYVSRNDVLTEQTAAEILDHNDTWEKQCK